MRKLQELRVLLELALEHRENPEVQTLLIIAALRPLKELQELQQAREGQPKATDKLT